MLDLLLPYTNRGLTDEPDFPGNPGSLSARANPCDRTRTSASPRTLETGSCAGRSSRMSRKPGDIFLATDQRLWFRWGHLIAGANGVHHSGIVVALPDGELRADRGGAIRQDAGRDDGSVRAYVPARRGGRPGLGAPPAVSTHARAVRAADGVCLCPGRQAIRAGAVVRPVDAAAHPGTDQDLVRRWAARRPASLVLLRAGRSSAAWRPASWTGRPPGRRRPIPATSSGAAPTTSTSTATSTWSGAGARRPDGCPRRASQASSSSHELTSTLRPDPGRFTEHLHRGVASVDGDHAAAGMGARPAEEDAGHGRAG